MDKPKVRVSIVPGKQNSGEITLENPSDEERHIQLYLEDWHYVPSQDGTKEFLPAASLNNSASPWISFSPADFILRPHSRQRISYTIRMPEGSLGGYYAALFFEIALSKLEETAEGTAAGIGLNVRIATLFYVEAEGTIKRTGVLDNFKVENAGKDAPLSIKLDFANTGNVDITAGGTFNLMDRQGMVVARGEFDKIYTFPNDKAQLTGIWKENLAPGKYDLVITLDFGLALAELKIGKGGPVVTKEAQIEIGTGGRILSVGELK
ncbi:MAG: hypothetical protein Q8L26_06630 [Candidatus Omnitrophota bacterium]|nr:hypothetical protein [Candidatus Omnitrophota bacterium]